MFSNDGSFSMPARFVRRLALSFKVVMAGRGCVTSVCNDSIIQLERSRDTSLESLHRLSGISVKRFEDRLKDLRDGTRGWILLSGSVWSPLSASDK